MAVKDGSGPRPAPQPAKRRFLNCLETIASTLAFSCRQLESEDPRTVPQASNTMAVKDGSGPRPAPQPAKRRFLNCLETIASTLAFSCRPLGSEDRAAGLKHHGSEGRIGPAAGTPACQTSLSELPRNYSFNPCFFLPSARSLLFPAVSSGPRTVPQASNTMKRRFLNCLETIASTPACQTSLSELPRNYSFNPCFFLPSARVRGPCRRPQTPWQWRTDRARGRHPSLPNVAFWTA